MGKKENILKLINSKKRLILKCDKKARANSQIIEVSRTILNAQRMQRGWKGNCPFSSKRRRSN
ncbi:hypothetical protein E1A91_D13G225700v1 [Gossypium mustelinum]|uniref:Uncharacterized protein n=1 Tax=Gossypium mustelinum TaxID=34275 RepID=A0A5D2S6G9_GOSMU|nr:hypothetical protein E1A91_D13G225700v1 [Gossypium mustelinum]